jgi:hypothetical protein
MEARRVRSPSDVNVAFSDERHCCVLLGPLVWFLADRSIPVTQPHVVTLVVTARSASFHHYSALTLGPHLSPGRNQTIPMTLYPNKTETDPYDNRLTASIMLTRCTEPSVYTMEITAPDDNEHGNTTKRK